MFSFYARFEVRVRVVVVPWENVKIYSVLQGTLFCNIIRLCNKNIRRDDRRHEFLIKKS